jgi:uncharacterized protein
MDNPIQVDLGRIAQDLQIKRVQVESVVKLLDEANTVPFITRYRKEQTGNLNEVMIREIQIRVQKLRDLVERKETILKTIEAQGKLTPDLATAIRAADNPKRLEDLYLPFKPKKRTKASEARDRGLEPLAFRIWTRDETLIDLNAAAQEFVNAEKGVESVEKVLEGVGHILAEAISEMAAVRDAVRRVVWKTGKIVTTKAEIPEGQGLEYRDYFDYSEPAAQMPPHRVLAINRGDKEGPLKVRLDVSRPDLEAVLVAQLPLEGHPHVELFHAAAIDALDRLILPSMEREVRRDLTEGAEKHAVEVFAKNLRSLLLQPPITKQVVMAVDPGFRTGCKLAILDRDGNLIDQTVIYPHAPQNRRSEAKVTLKDLVGKYHVGVVAIGNGTACRETEELIAEIITEGTEFNHGRVPVHAPAPVSEPAADSQRHGEPAHQAQPDQLEASVETEPTHAAPPAEPANDEGSIPHNAEASAAADESPSDVHDHALSSVPGSDHHANSPGSENHVSAQSDAPLESLPPISGGSPESPASEPGTDLEIESMPDNTHDANASAVMAQSPAAGTAHAESDSNSGSHTDLGHAADSHSAHAEASAVEPPAAETTEAPAAELPAEMPAESPAHSEPAGSAASEAPAAAESAPAEAIAANTSAAPTKPHGGRGGPKSGSGRGPKPDGRGKSDSSRQRPPRNKPAGPVVQTPPQPHPADPLLEQLSYVVVNEAGASVYSTSQVGREELPDLDATLRSGVSIGRRLLDPLAELVKIEPQNIGVGLYQHDVNPKQLKETLESVISSCVNFVGVDLNSASIPLLRHVSGLNQLTARRIVEYRKEHGPFANRAQLTAVEGIGPATFTQAAGFLKLPDGENPLDRTWIHPESYPAAIKLLEKLGYEPEVVRDKSRLPEVQAKLVQVNPAELSRELEIGELTLRDILESLARPERDPRDDLPKPIFKKGVLKLEDLSPGMELKGTVLNVVDFGAFVDIGLKDSGLVHISQLANRYVKSPHDVVSVGDVVTAWVMGVDQERKRVSLTMVKPGTERLRGPQQGGRRPGGPDEQRQPRDRDGRAPGQGQGQRGAPKRPPTPAPSALTSPPVGAPSVAQLAEAAPRRPERDPSRDRDRGGPRGPESRGGDQGGSHGPPAGGPPRQGSGPPPGRGGGPRGPYPGQGGPGGRPQGRQDQPATNRPPPRPARPSPPPPPLSKDAIAGNVPLRSFGQLKQLWQARTDDPVPPVSQPAGGDDQSARPPDDQPPRTDPAVVNPPAE